jgi:predicted Zn-dependent protease
MMKTDVTALPQDYNRSHNSYLRASYVVEDPTAAPILAPTDTTGLTIYHDAVDQFATAFVAIVNDDSGTATSVLNRLRREIDDAVVMSVAEGLHESENGTSADNYLLATIMARQIDALLLFRQGEIDQAIQIMMSAAADENGRPLYYGPPHVPKPSSELLGEMLLQIGKPQEAIVEFKKALDQNTGRSMSLLGLGRAQEMAGNGDEAQITSSL